MSLRSSGSASNEHFGMAPSDHIKSLRYCAILSQGRGKKETVPPVDKKSFGKTIATP